MLAFEFVVEGPAVSLRASRKSARRYQDWIRRVRGAAQQEWPADRRPTSRNVEVTISIYYTAALPDVDNIIKPLLDALNGLAYDDDQQVHRVISQKIAMTSGDRVINPSVLLAGALQQLDEVVHVLVRWEE